MPIVNVKKVAHVLREPLSIFIRFLKFIILQRSEQHNMLLPLIMQKPESLESMPKVN